MSARPLLFGALIGFLACSCSVPRPRGPVRPPEASDFEAAIARLQRADPASPAVLSTKLAFAQFLLSKAAGPCAQRLTLAQEQLGSVGASPQAHVMFPDGWALVADLEYQQHLGRASCASPGDRRDEWLAAVEAARRAVRLYRNEFEYHSMVIMQFDTAIALRRLGENAAALTALRQTLRMDREYGFADDARENFKLLLIWRGEPAGTEQVARLMQGFPLRRVTLKFGWHPSDARITLKESRVTFDGGQIAHSRAAAAFERHTGAAPAGGWSVTYSHRFSGYEPGVWPSDPGAQKRPLVFPPAPLPTVDFKVSAGGEFVGVRNAKAFATRLTTWTDKLIRAGAPTGDRARDAADSVVGVTARDFSPGMLEADAAQNYQLETAMWVGATLEQGVWYEISAPMSLPGMSEFVVEQRIDFAFTRRLPCTAGAADRRCVEIVIRATPDPKSLAHVLEDLGGAPPNSLFADYFASTEVRIVTDPATLLPYAREERVYWYASIGNTTADAILESDHLLCTTRYARE
jgi:hypothetical protein